ncbi:MAG: 3-phosphoshikimate 1-carboxyvinyltransferase, partial [Bacteroidota bacterium]
MKKSIQPSVISGTIDAPASKSMAQRALAAALLANGTTRLYKLSSNNDSDAATEIIERLGAVVSQEEDYLQITSNGIISPNEVNCGEAGLSVRMFTPISSLANGTVTLNGEGSLRNRPVDMV